MERSDNHLLIECLFFVENIIYRMLCFVKKAVERIMYVKILSIFETGQSMNAIA